MANPDSMLLGWENFQVLNLVQAMLGEISSNMRAVSLQAEGDGVRIYFLLAEEIARDRESIEDIVFEFEALQLKPIELDVSIVVSAKVESLHTMPGRKVYLIRAANRRSDVRTPA